MLANGLAPFSSPMAASKAAGRVFAPREGGGVHIQFFGGMAPELSQPASPGQEFASPSAYPSALFTV